MASNRDPLKLVQMLAEVSEFEKSKQVAASMLSLTAEEQRLALLEQYLGEYRAALATSGDGLDITLIKARHDFIDALTRAICDQGARVDSLRQRVRGDLGTWRHAKARANAVERYTDRLAERERQEAERREQAALDEVGRRPARAAAIRPARRD